MTGALDLHTHSTYSDGQHSPAEIVRMAQRLDLRAIAVSDHDTMEGIDEALLAAADSDLLVVPAVELSVDHGGLELHLLGYYVDHSPGSALGDLLAKSRVWRLERAQAIVDRLASRGIEIDWRRLQAIAGEGAIGRPHIAQALIERGVVASVREAFDRYLVEGRPAYVPRQKLAPQQAISAVLVAGGVPVLAHPWGLMNLLDELVPMGLEGLEVYYTGYGPEKERLLGRYASEYRLLETGGSDFHGRDVNPNNVLGGVDVPLACLEALRARAGQRE